MQSTLKILFLDDHKGLQEGIADFLKRKNPDFDFYLASNQTEAKNIISQNKDLSLAIVDLNLDSENGLDFVNQLRAEKQGEGKSLPIIIYTMYCDPIHIENAVKCGIQAYITKNAPIDELEQAIKTVADGGTFFSKAANKTIQMLLTGKSSAAISGQTEENNSDLLYANYKTLTEIEQKVFQLLAQRKEIEEIADILGKKEKTILNKRSIIYQKLGIIDRLDLLEKAKLLGIIE